MVGVTLDWPSGRADASSQVECERVREGRRPPPVFSPHVLPTFAFIMPPSRYTHASAILGAQAHGRLKTSKVLVVGAGGIGSELRPCFTFASRSPRRVGVAHTGTLHSRLSMASSSLQ